MPYLHYIILANKKVYLFMRFFFSFTYDIGLPLPIFPISCIFGSSRHDRGTVLDRGRSGLCPLYCRDKATESCIAAPQSPPWWPSCWWWPDFSGSLQAFPFVGAVLYVIVSSFLPFFTYIHSLGTKLVVNKGHYPIHTFIYHFLNVLLF